MLEIRPAKEIKGNYTLPPSPDFLLCASLLACAARKEVRMGPASDSPYTRHIEDAAAAVADISHENDSWVIKPKTDTLPVFKLPSKELRFSELAVFILLGMNKTVCGNSLSDKRIAAWQVLASYAGCEIGIRTFDDGTRGIYLVSADAFTLPAGPLAAHALHACIGLALGIGRTIEFTIDYQFASFLRHLLPALGYSLTVKSGDSSDAGQASRRMRFAPRKKKSDQGLLYTVRIDGSAPAPGPATLVIPGDDILGTLLIAAKSLVQKGNLIIDNMPLETWALPMLNFVRKMGCRPAVQESRDTSVGRVGLIQLQHFEIQGRKNECIPLLHFAGHLPAMVILSCFAQGQSVFRNLEDLRNDEPDGIERILECVRKLGGRHGEMPDGIVIDGAKQLDGFDIDMPISASLGGACAIAGLKCMGKTTIFDGEILDRWPDFKGMLNSLCEYRK